ncbi:MAG: chemotaxis protein CheW [Gammaproteobacteria bacterium]
MAREDVYAVLVSLASDTLLLPNAAVAEVISAERVDPPPAGSPPWLAGRATYNNRQLAVVRFETMNGGTPPEDSRRTRLAVIQPLTGALRTGQYAIVCQGYPHLVTLNRTALKREQLVSGDDDALVLTRVSIANTNALIPNLEKIEELLAPIESSPA